MHTVLLKNYLQPKIATILYNVTCSYKHIYKGFFPNENNSHTAIVYTNKFQCFFQSVAIYLEEELSEAKLRWISYAIIICVRIYVER